jgi:cytoskeletal protein RodZ
MAATAPSPIDVGEALRTAREQRGLTLGKAAEDTMIQGSYLQVLEDNGSPEQFPAPVFGRFYLREYATYLDLEDEPLLAAYPVPQPGDELPHIPLDTELKRPARGPWVLGVLAAVVLAGLIAFVAIRLVSHPTGTVGHPSAQASVVAPALSSGASSGGSSKPAAATDIRVVVGATTADCWVQATADGKPALAQTIVAGQQVTVRAKHRLNLVLGNPDHVQVSVNGQRLQAPASGTGVQHLSLVLRHGRVVVA